MVNGALDLVDEGSYVSDTFFYLSVLTVIVTLLICFAIGVWAFVEFILILMRNGRYGLDAQGGPLR